MDNFKRFSQKEIGPGGIKCPCCSPKPGKDRQALRRRARRRMKMQDRRNPLDKRNEE